MICVASQSSTTVCLCPVPICCCCSPSRATFLSAHHAKHLRMPTGLRTMLTPWICCYQISKPETYIVASLHSRCVVLYRFSSLIDSPAPLYPSILSWAPTLSRCNALWRALDKHAVACLLGQHLDRCMNQAFSEKQHAASRALSLGMCGQRSRDIWDCISDPPRRFVFIL